MRLSEAIRLGATMKPQWFDTYYPDYNKTASCAMGAAFDASGINWQTSFHEWPEAWKLTTAAIARANCPDCCELASVPHLNDAHRWTRERIADFVELHEPQDCPDDESLLKLVEEAQ